MTPTRIKFVIVGQVGENAIVKDQELKSASAHSFSRPDFLSNSRRVRGSDAQSVL